MRKQLVMVTGVLVMLGAAVSGAFGDADLSDARASVASAQAPANLSETDQLVARWNSSPASVPLARPL